MLKLNEPCSGNLKLRVPKSLHHALAERAEKEGISMNQLCLMLLSSKLSENGLGTEEFYRRMEQAESLYANKEALLLTELRKLSEEVEARKPMLLKELKDIYEENSDKMNEQLEALKYCYPFYFSASKIPFMKIPSAKVVLSPSEFIPFQEINELMRSIPNTAVAYGDYDYYVPFERREVTPTRMYSLVISLCCKFEHLFHTIQEIKEKITDAGYDKIARISVKPIYLHTDLRDSLREAYPGEAFLDLLPL